MKLLKIYSYKKFYKYILRGVYDKQLLEKLQEDMELRRIFKVHLLSQRKRNNRIFWKTMKQVSTKELRDFY